MSANPAAPGPAKKTSDPNSQFKTADHQASRPPRAKSKRTPFVPEETGAYGEKPKKEKFVVPDIPARFAPAAASSSSSSSDTEDDDARMAREARRRRSERIAAAKAKAAAEAAIPDFEKLHPEAAAAKAKREEEEEEEEEEAAASASAANPKALSKKKSSKIAEARALLEAEAEAARRAAPPPPPVVVSDFTREIFSLLDADGDGVITNDALADALAEDPTLAHTLGVSAASNSPSSAAALEEFYASLRDTGSHPLTLEEFAAAFGAHVDEAHDAALAIVESARAKAGGLNDPSGQSADANAPPVFLTAAAARTFNQIDKNGDGVVTVRELIIALRADESLAVTLGLVSGKVRQEDGTRDALLAFFDSLDANGDRELTMEEFAAVFCADVNAPRSSVSLPNGNGGVMIPPASPPRPNEHHAPRDEWLLPSEITRAGASAEAAVKILSARGTPARATSPTSTAKRSDYALVAPSVMSDMMGDGDESDPDSSSGEDETVEEIFARLDADGSGSLSVEELIFGLRSDATLAKKMGLSRHNITTKEGHQALESFFRALDANSDRELSLDEFRMVFGAGGAGKTPKPSAAAKQSAKNKKAMNAELGGMRAELDKLRDMMSSLLVNPAETQLNQMRALLEDIVVRTSPESSVKTAADSTSTAYDGWALGTTKYKNYDDYCKSEDFKNTIIRPALKTRFLDPAKDTSPWRRSLKKKGNPAPRGRTPRYDCPEPEPMCVYKSKWRDGLRNDDGKGYAVLNTGKGYRDRERWNREDPLAPGAAFIRDRRNPYAPTMARMNAMGVDLETAEALRKVTVGGSGRIFSRAFTRLYLTPQTRRELEKNPTVNPPGVKTSFDDLYGVVGLSPSKHKEDLRHRAAMQPVSFHRNVVGDDASTMTSTPSGELSKYPREFGYARGSGEKKTRLFIP